MDREDIRILTDTPLEFVLLSYYSPEVLSVRPPDAEKILPANNPRAAGLKLGSAVLKELAELKFLDPSNTAAIGRYEGMITFISDRNGVSRAEMQGYLRQGIAATVDAEFNKIDFMVNINSRMSYNCMLTRSVNNQYVLSYESYFGTDTKSKRELSGNSLELFLAALSNSRDFTPSAINTVRAQAALIPAVVLANIGQTDAFFGTIKKALADFYLNPTITNYNTVKDILSLFTRRAYEYHQDPFFEILDATYTSILGELSRPLQSKILSDAHQEKYAASTLTQTQIRTLTVTR